ncbi:MAG TPA: hypothetical protein VFD83_03760 [Candidatus Polarisedimenticolia bacterium]|nr:hypothetical protein [Candidatus Polarisedimenticolia bacterium]
MLGLILRFLLFVVAFRFLGAVARMLSAPKPAPRVAPKAPKPLVDRATAIDVPFTEEAGG